jgi:hypothetical protein
MRQASKRIPQSAEKTVRDIRRATRRHYSAEEKIRIVLEGLRAARKGGGQVDHPDWAEADVPGPLRVLVRRARNRASQASV